MHTKQKPIINDKLLRTYHKMQCDLCDGKWQVSAHHHVRRSKIRLDVEANLTPLCVKCHTMLESSPDQFKRLFGNDNYIYLTTLKHDMTVGQILEKYKEE